jgi:hypothetical protein
MTKIIAVLPSELKGLAKKFNDEMKWCYIGKKVTEREKISQVLGEEKRFYLRDRLQKIPIREISIKE